LSFNCLYRDVLDGLKARYGDKLLSVVLFGSRFQGRAKAHSDLDILVLLSEAEDEDRYRFRLATEHLRRAERLFKLGDWVGVVNSAQLAVENFAKA